jgi:hypothetical protein
MALFSLRVWVDRPLPIRLELIIVRDSKDNQLILPDEFTVEEGSSLI